MTISSASHTASLALVGAIERVSRLHEARRETPALAVALERIAVWQARRMRQMYRDLASQSRYAEAIAFFETDLYGGGDFARRDADLGRVVPIVVRMLPASVVASIAQAMELNALSQELDRVLIAHLPNVNDGFTVADYCTAYRHSNNRPLREHQIRLIGVIGEALDGYVRKPMIRAAIVMMRRPARLAGVAVLHDFLERGFHAFRRMHGASLFLSTIAGRETSLMDAMFNGDTAPFEDPGGTSAHALG